MELTLVSYNIHSGIGTDGRFDLHRVGEVLREINADIIALQEVGDFRGRRRREDQPEHLAELLGLHMAFGPNVVRNGRRYGNAILTRLPILKSQNYDSGVQGREPRGALRCDLDLGEGRPLHVFCLHLGLSLGERRRAGGAAAVGGHPPGRGAQGSGGGVRRLQLLGQRAGARAGAPGDPRRARWSWAQPSRTYHSRLPLLRLDRIFVDAGVRPARPSAPTASPLAAVASDHLPLVMRFEAPVAAEPPGGLGTRAAHRVAWVAPASFNGRRLRLPDT